MTTRSPGNALYIYTWACMATTLRQEQRESAGAPTCGCGDHGVKGSQGTARAEKQSMDPQHHPGEDLAIVGNHYWDREDASPTRQGIAGKSTLVRISWMEKRIERNTSNKPGRLISTHQQQVLSWLLRNMESDGGNNRYFDAHD